MPGFDQPYTSDDIEAIVSAADATVEERCEVLRRILNDLENRQDMDRTQEFAPLIDEVRPPLPPSANRPTASGRRALSPTILTNGRSLDEILEREEEEDARRQAEGD